MSMKLAPFSDVKVSVGQESQGTAADSIDAYAHRQALRIAELPPDLQQYLLNKLRRGIDHDRDRRKKFERVRLFLDDMGVEVNGGDAVVAAGDEG